MPLLQPGDRLSIGAGQKVRIVRYLASGGEGEVFEVDVDGTRCALKWYFANRAHGQRRRELRELVRRESPGPQFLWPYALVEDAARASFGYLMDLLPTRYVDLNPLVRGDMSPEPSFPTLCRAAIGLASGIRALNLGGLCYKDINFGNAFFDKLTGDVRICDNDNVCVLNSQTGDMSGTGPFRAPELWRNEQSPSDKTDRHSLAVLFFYMFVRSHPLEGQRAANCIVWDHDAQRFCYGTDPVFIFDRDNERNRPVPGKHDSAIRNWPVYPATFRDLFGRAFGEGLRDPDRRITANEWIQALSGLCNSRVLCHECLAEQYLDISNRATGYSPACWRCKSQLRVPLHITVGDRTIMLSSDTQLFQHHFRNNFDFGVPAAEVSRHPGDSNRFGLRNLTEETWSYKAFDGTLRQVPPGKSAPLLDGLVLNFGTVRGYVKAG